LHFIGDFDQTGDNGSGRITATAAPDEAAQVVVEPLKDHPETVHDVYFRDCEFGSQDFKNKTVQCIRKPASECRLVLYMQ
jgi:hypothetical protein